MFVFVCSFFYFVLFENLQPVELFKILKVQITLKQFARDWSSEGADERKQCYQPIIDEILAHFNQNEM